MKGITLMPATLGEDTSAPRAFTVFCRQTNGRGTTWISTVLGIDIEDAKTNAVAQCASDWGWEDHANDITVIGVIKGGIELLEWTDQGED